MKFGWNFYKRKKSFHITKFSLVALLFAIVLFLYSLSVIVALVWGFFASLKGSLEFAANLFYLPRGHIWEWKWSNYEMVLSNFIVPVYSGEVRYEVTMPMMALYSVLYAGGCSFLATLTPCVVGYLITRFPNKFSKVISAVALVAIIIPIVGNNVSMLQMLHTLGLYDTMIGNWIMSMSFISIYMFVFSAAFKGVAKTYSEAAEIDGANNFTVFFRINLPLVKSAFFSVMLLMFIARWNDYSMPLLYMPSKPTLAYGIYSFNFTTLTELSWPPFRIAGSMILVLPMFVLFLLFHKRLMGNLSMGGIKE